MTKKRKKFLTMTLAALLSLSLFGCNGSPQDTGSTGGETGGSSDNGGASGGETMVGNWYDDENFKPVIRFTVTADTHFGTGTTDFYYWTQDLFADVFQHGYNYAASQDYDTMDAFIDVGDWLDHGLPGEYENFINVVDANLRDETTFIPVLAGHELINGTVDDFTTNMRIDTGVHTVINGFHLIAIGNVNNTSPCKGFEWVKEQVEEAYNDDPYKPIFVFQHHPINDTIWSSNDNLASDQYHEIYKNYPNVMLFTAHTHVPGSDPANILQHDYTSLGVASTAYNGGASATYFELAPTPYGKDFKQVDEVPTTMTYEYAIDEEHKGVGEFYIVEADEYGRTRVLIYDVYQNGFKANFDGEGTMAYYFEDVTDKSTWLYTAERGKEDSAPQFEEGSEIVIVSNGNGKAKIQWSQAKGKYGVLAYDAFLKNNATGETRSVRINSLQWMSLMPETRSYEFTGLQSGAEYALTIEPVNSFAKYGDPLTVTFTAA